MHFWERPSKNLKKKQKHLSDLQSDRQNKRVLPQDSWINGEGVMPPGWRSRRMWITRFDRKLLDFCFCVASPRLPGKRLNRRQNRKGLWCWSKIRSEPRERGDCRGENSSRIESRLISAWDQAFEEPFWELCLWNRIVRFLAKSFPQSEARRRMQNSRRHVQSPLCTLC